MMLPPTMAKDIKKKRVVLVFNFLGGELNTKFFWKIVLADYFPMHQIRKLWKTNLTLVFIFWRLYYYRLIMFAK